MIQAKTQNPGVLAAIREVKVMGLGKNLRLLYEAHMKEIRDRNARDEYVYDEGWAGGKADSLICILEDKGVLSEELEKRIRSQQDGEVLNGWLKIAAGVGTIEAFREKAGI